MSGARAVHLEPMAEDTFAAYVDALAASYAAEHAAHGRWTVAEARQRAAEEIGALLPQGLATPDHALLAIVEAQGGAQVGVLWLAVRRDEGRSRAFVYDLAIDPAWRRQGFGEAAMRAAEDWALRRGEKEITLHVFGTNQAALALYEKLGFRKTNIMMAKSLTQGGSAP